MKFTLKKVMVFGKKMSFWGKNTTELNELQSSLIELFKKKLTDKNTYIYQYIYDSITYHELHDVKNDVYLKIYGDFHGGFLEFHSFSENMIKHEIDLPKTVHKRLTQSLDFVVIKRTNVLKDKMSLKDVTLISNAISK
jgi:hypothetical protein